MTFLAVTLIFSVLSASLSVYYFISKFPRAGVIFLLCVHMVPYAMKPQSLTDACKCCQYINNKWCNFLIIQHLHMSV